ncbi:hypothetical protein BaRGS_00027195 [Batillaria attramentaria]|uniref:Uncharacterized protein n=1 Tax=Batillaria attramentaria TaxID=370345 RepID=A0ABD0K3X5_9CAEN|nr:hypothetical protein BaRGS_011303 [Batillaria attramentaria]
MASPEGESGCTSSVTLKRRESLTCALCLDVFRSPKLLSCLHTYCEGCLKDLVELKTTSKFPCPSCRKQIEVPPGGVSKFPTNFYIDPDDLEQARNCSECPKHPRRDLEFICIQCDMQICLNCKLTDHELHPTKDLKKLVDHSKIQLSKDTERLRRCVADAEKSVEVVTNEQAAVKIKRGILVAEIHNRHTTVLHAANKWRDEALASLDNTTDDLAAVLEVELYCRQEKARELRDIHQKAQQALDDGENFELVTVAREMKCGRGSEESVQKLTTKQTTAISRPVLRFGKTSDRIVRDLRDFIGSAVKLEVEISPPEVSVVEKFQCGLCPDTEVFSLCPLDDGTLWVSYEQSLQHDAAVKKFSENGQILVTWKDVTGRVSGKSRTGDACMFAKPDPGSVYTFAKSKVNLRLNNHLAGKAKVTRVEIISESPFTTEPKTEFTINCAAHRAFDTDSSEQLFVVLEETQAPDLQRTVRLYRRPQPYAITTYSPPVAPFQPSDVCFYTLGGDEVLLVADELNDAIHVVNVQDGRLSFARYLAPGCPLLVQPTALNTDNRGRLWVACRGGKIITYEPIV